MKLLKNPWLNTLARSYDEIKRQIVSKLPAHTPEITDTTSGNIFMIIINIWAAMAEVLHYYIDNVAQETFLVTARRYSSIRKHAEAVDYHVKCAHPSSVDITLSVGNNALLFVAGAVPKVIPAGTTVLDTNGNTWQTTKAHNWPPGATEISLPIEQTTWYKEDYTPVGVFPGRGVELPLPELGPGEYYVEGSCLLHVGGVNWKLVETFAYSGPKDLHFKIEPSIKNHPAIIFGNGLKGALPATGSQIDARFKVTKALNIPPNSFTSISWTYEAKEPKVINHYASSGATKYEGFEEIKQNLPLSLRTLGVAITKSDYEAVVSMLPGVAKSYVDYVCGRYLRIFIVPAGGGIASQGLCDEVLKKLGEVKSITTSINVLPTQEASLKLSLSVTGKPSYKALGINQEVTAALVNKYNAESHPLGRTIRLSDIYALVDNLPLVDHLKIDHISTVPSISPQSDTLFKLFFSEFEYQTATFTEPISIKVIATGPNKAVLVYPGEYEQPITMGKGFKLAFSKVSINATIKLRAAMTLEVGETHIFTLVPINDDQPAVGISQVVLYPNNLTLHINET